MLLFNGRPVPAEEAGVPVGSQGFSFGFGLFETIRMTRGKLEFFDEHIRRLSKGLATIGMEWPESLEDPKSSLIEAARINGVEDCGLKLCVFKGTAGTEWFISVRGITYTEAHYEKGYALKTVASTRNTQSMLVTVKSNNYMENIICRGQALEAGADEALFFNQMGHVAEGALSNIFFVKDNVLYTPSEHCGILPGILRAAVIDMAKASGITVVEGPVPELMIGEAQESFITNSLMRIMPVRAIDEIEYEVSKQTLTAQLMERMHKVVDDDNS